MDMNDTIRKDGLFACFRPKMPKSFNKVSAVIRRNKSSKFEETATFEFECRRFSMIEVEQQKWRNEVRKSWEEYDEIKGQIKEHTNETLENLRLQSQVYREEVNSLKRQIEELKQERRFLADDILPAAVNRRRSVGAFN